MENSVLLDYSSEWGFTREVAVANVLSLAVWSRNRLHVQYRANRYILPASRFLLISQVYFCYEQNRLFYFSFFCCCVLHYLLFYTQNPAM